MCQLPLILQLFPYRVHVSCTDFSGGTIIIKNNQPTKVQLSQLGSSKRRNLSPRHPSGKYIIFSTNTTRQSFYSRNPNLIEVYDLESDLVLYDLVHNTVITDPRFNGPASFETFPAWAPDGKRLYYCTAPARQLPKRLKEIKYSICVSPLTRTTVLSERQSTRSIRHTIKALHSPVSHQITNICFSPNRIMQLSRSGIRKRI